MVPKPLDPDTLQMTGFRAVLFRMVPKQAAGTRKTIISFRAVLFRMVPKLEIFFIDGCCGFRAVLFRMVPKRFLYDYKSSTFQSCVVSNGSKTHCRADSGGLHVLELCCFEWFQNGSPLPKTSFRVLELCCFEWFQNLCCNFF